MNVTAFLATCAAHADERWREWRENLDLSKSKSVIAIHASHLRIIENGQSQVVVSKVCRQQQLLRDHRLKNARLCRGDSFFQQQMKIVQVCTQDARTKRIVTDYELCYYVIVECVPLDEVDTNRQSLPTAVRVSHTCKGKEMSIMH